MPDQPTKRPEQTNLGGLWLHNPQAPRAIQTNLEGVKREYNTASNLGNRLDFDPHGTSHTGKATVVPTAWLIDVDPGVEILTGAEVPVLAGGTELEGQHILIQQSVTERDRSRGEAGQPARFSSDLGRTLDPVIHCVWWDSVKYVTREGSLANDGGVLLTERSVFRGHLWSLYYGMDPTYLGIDFVYARRWWIVCQLEPVPEAPGADLFAPFRFSSKWVFSHPERDDGVQATAATAAGSLDQQTRFDPLGANVFKRVASNESSSNDTITARPYYG